MTNHSADPGRPEPEPPNGQHTHDTAMMLGVAAGILAAFVVVLAA